MPAGIEVIGAAGSLQVTSSFMNLAYADYFDVYVNTNIMSGLLFQEFINVDSAYLYAYRSLTAGAVVGLSVVQGRAMVASSRPATTVRIYRFRKDGTGPRSNMGLEVFKENGQLCFSSNVPYMKVQGYLPFSVLNNSSQTFNYPLRPAVVVGTLGFESYVTVNPAIGAYRHHVKVRGFSFSGNSVTVGMIADMEEYWDSPPVAAEYGSNATNAIVVDSSQLP